VIAFISSCIGLANARRQVAYYSWETDLCSCNN